MRDTTPNRPAAAPRDSRSRRDPGSRRLPKRTLILGAGGLAALLIVAGILCVYTLGGPATSRLRLADIPFDGAGAYEYLKKICTIGPRPSGSPGMAAQQKLLTEHFTKLGGKIELQRFDGRNPEDGSPVPMANLIVHWHPERKERILLCTHYDTLPYPLRDPTNKRGRFVGANDGASGAALLMALAHDMPKLQTRYGVDFVLFDGEEFIFQEDQPYFQGSEHFARLYVGSPPPYRYRWGVLLDMIGDAHLEIYQERNSMWWEDTRPLVEEIWATAARLGVREFIAKRKHEVRDDHLALHNIAGIPACDIIDFDYPDSRHSVWHTQADNPGMCSALSLAKVGWVLREWLVTTGKR
jgi:glutaminyl-peptide cyclotransferase